MRSGVLILVGLVVGILVLGSRQPDAQSVQVPVSTATVTELPSDFSELPTFVPSYPCEPHTAFIFDEKICRGEDLLESVAAQGKDAVFIEHDYSVSYGCMFSTTQETDQLLVCSPSTGVTTLVSNDFHGGPLVASPDGEWFAYTTIGVGGDAVKRIVNHIYKVREEGTDPVLLNTQSFPDWVVGGAVVDSWSADGTWISFTIHNNGSASLRIKSDGSGDYEVLSRSTATPYPTSAPRTEALSPTRGTPFIGTPPGPFPTATP